MVSKKFTLVGSFCAGAVKTNSTFALKKNLKRLAVLVLRSKEEEVEIRCAKETCPREPSGFSSGVIRMPPHYWGYDNIIIIMIDVWMPGIFSS